MQTTTSSEPVTFHLFQRVPTNEWLSVIKLAISKQKNKFFSLKVWFNSFPVLDSDCDGIFTNYSLLSFYI